MTMKPGLEGVLSRLPKGRCYEIRCSCGNTVTRCDCEPKDGRRRIVQTYLAVCGACRTASA